MTSKYRKLYWLFTLMSVLLNIAPMATYTIIAFSECNIIVEKVTLSMTLLIVLILTIVSWMNKIALRSRLWILLIGLYLCLDYIMIPVMLIAACQVLDELLVSPCRRSFKTKLTIHKELDKRQEA